MIPKSEISFVRSLSDRRTRDESGLFVVEGRKMVGEALASGWRVRKVYGVGEGEWEEASSRDMERMSSLRTPQGILAVVEKQEVPAFEGGLALALDGIQDPGNIGTILRTAEWFGIRRILCSPDCVDCFNPKAVQASMGAIFRVAVVCGPLDLPEGIPVYGTFLDGENIYTAPLTAEGIVVLGSEGRGISPAVAARITRRLHIPSLSPCAESLNVAAATAVVCSEFRRPR